jgi:acetyl esterase/lipase
MMEKLKAAGVRAELFTAPGAKHAFFNSPPWYEPALKRMEEFFDSILRPQGGI